MIIENTTDQTKADMFLDVELRRPQSMSELGFARLMLCVSLLSLIAGSILWAIGAWPVIGFMGMDALLIWLAFRHYRSQVREDYERITLDAGELVVYHCQGKQVISERYEPAFMNIIYDDARDPVQIASRGKLQQVGRWLSPAERQWLAVRLRKALRERLDGLAHLSHLA